MQNSVEGDGNDTQIVDIDKFVENVQKLLFHYEERAAFRRVPGKHT